MLTSGTLNLLAAIGERYLENKPTITPAAEQGIRIAIADAKSAAQAANGMSTRATFMLSIALNDRALDRAIRQMVEDTKPDYGDISENNTPSTIARMIDEVNAMADADLADKLRKFIETLCVSELIIDPAETLLKIGYSEVDWHALARYYREP